MPMAREIYQEGFGFHPSCWRRGGRIDRDLLRLIVANVRYAGGARRRPAGTAHGEFPGDRRLREIAAKYGAAAVRGTCASFRITASG